MSAVTFTPTTGSVGFADGETLTFASAAATGFCTKILLNGKKLRIEPVYASGELGAGTQNFQGGEQKVELSVIYVCATAQDCWKLFLSDSAALASGEFTMTIDTMRPFEGCILSTEAKAAQPRANGQGTIYMHASFSVTCLRPN